MAGGQEMWEDAGDGHRQLTHSVARYDENGPISTRDSASHHITMLHYPGLDSSNFQILPAGDCNFLPVPQPKTPKMP